MTDHRTVRLVVLLLGLITGLLVVGVLVLALVGKPIAEGLLTLAGTGLGSLASVLVSTRGSGGSEPVPVTTAPGDAVTVTEAPPPPPA